MHYHHLSPLRGENKTRKLNVNKMTQVKNSHKRCKQTAAHGLVSNAIIADMFLGFTKHMQLTVSYNKKRPMLGNKNRN